MRAREALALCIWRRGALEEAAEHMQAMLELNPNDNQGMRYSLMAVLQHLRKEPELAALLKQYPEDSAFWTYTDALAGFRALGATAATAKRLRAALKSNRHVPALLLGTKRLPKTMPDFVGIGDVAEAVVYAADNREGWAAAEGALAWLAEQADRPVAKKPVAKRPDTKPRRTRAQPAG